MYYITKRFKNYPFAHRQHTHDGHCAWVHGHNWDFEICLESAALDENGFVFDFGKFKDFKDWLSQKFDHTCLINRDDPMLPVFRIMHDAGLMKLMEIDSCSSEGIARIVAEELIEFLESMRGLDKRKINVVWVKVYEDEKNTAVYKPKQGDE